jgi:hypothetical protein
MRGDTSARKSPAPKPEPAIDLDVAIDPHAPRGDLVPALARLLRKLRDRKLAEAQSTQGDAERDRAPGPPGDAA